ncbi:response regulator transcription factor [Nocardioides sp. HDW12B]|uniref:LuxR C-terminal-related transcriptional regulator n=1 Tax=Nocardioides sp. HDW12B TaxID=2714939 RepID=UPI00140D6F09|nr:LuxR C-terminal-related transcriptional regulator [Nocardioides sp. HDW12B]QIK67808.1 response regulator transcription factor [Nocardioides sp. HDW12B]
MKRPVTFVSIDNHEFVVESMASLERRRPEELRYLGGVSDPADLDRSLPAPDVVVLDLYLGRDDAVSTPAIPGLVAWGAAVLIHTSAELPVPVRQAVAAGASGLTLKNDGSDRLAEAVLEVADGGFACSSTVASALLADAGLVAALTPREVEVLQGVDDGLTRRQVAGRLRIAESTVTDHLKSARTRYLALGRPITNSQSLLREARRDGWISDR